MWNGSPQRELTQNPLSGKLGADHWERHHAAIKALDVLRACTTQRADNSLRRLRTRLIDLGHYEAITINPPNTTE
jgi:hypothetical protein